MTTRAILESALKAHLSGDLSKAKNLYLQAINSGTKDPAAHANLGFIFKEEGQLTEAIKQTEKALSLDPRNDLFLTNAGGIHIQLCNYTAAIQFSIKAISLNPNNPLAHANLGTSYRLTGKLDAAKLALQKSLQLQPNNPITIVTLGGLNLEMNELDSASKAASNAIKIAPDYPKAYTLLGKINQVTGNLEIAKDYFKQALKLNPTEVEAIFCISTDIDQPKDAEDLIAKASFCANTQLSSIDQAFLHHAYANCYHNLRNYSEAAKHLRHAHQYKSASYATSEAEQLIKEIQSLKNFTDHQHSKPDPIDNHKYIFIVGMPRSGSTLLESILSLNSGFKDLGESRAMSMAIDQLLYRNSKKKPTKTSLEEYYREIIQPDITERITHTIDKQLYNFKYAGIIALHLPGSKIIHCKRHPLDNILSLSRSNLTHGNNYTSSVVDSARVLIEQEKAMRYYQKENNKNQFYTFNYDSFVAQPREALKPLISWLGIEWDDTYLQPEKNNRNILTASVIQARKPISNKSLAGWKNYRYFLEDARREIEASGLFNDFNLSPD